MAETGDGHRAAANALVRALAMVGGSARVECRVVDAFAACGRFLLREAVARYGPVTRRCPRLYGQLFSLTNSRERFTWLSACYQPFLRQGLRDLFLRLRPDLVISVHPLLNAVTLQVIYDLGLSLPVVTVVTDLVSAHVSWFARDVAACVVPTEASRALALAHGLPSSRVHLLGLPIDPDFAAPVTSSPRARRLALGLAADLPVVLAVGGGEGVGGLPAVAEWLATHPLDAQLLVVTGRNRDLYARLAGMRDRFVTPTHLLGYVRNMPELMRAADVVVTKAGPAAICEAAACGLPIVLTGAIPGQETGNISYVVEHRLGKLGATPEAVARHLGALLRATPLRRRQMRAHALASSRPHAAFDIARLIIDHCPRLAIDAWRMERGS